MQLTNNLVKVKQRSLTIFSWHFRHTLYLAKKTPKYLKFKLGSSKSHNWRLQMYALKSQMTFFLNPAPSLLSASKACPIPLFGPFQKLGPPLQVHSQVWIKLIIITIAFNGFPSIKAVKFLCKIPLCVAINRLLNLLIM